MVTPGIEELIYKCAEDPHFVFPFLVCLSAYSLIVILFERYYYDDIFLSGEVRNYKSFHETFFDKVHLMFLLIIHVGLAVGLAATGAFSRLDQTFTTGVTVGAAIILTITTMFVADVMVHFCGFHLFRWDAKKWVEKIKHAE